MPGSDVAAGEFYIAVNPRANASLTEIERVIDSVVATLIAAPPTSARCSRSELRLGRRGDRAPVGARQGRDACRRPDFAGDPLHYIADTRATLAVTPADIHRVAKHTSPQDGWCSAWSRPGKLDMVSNPNAPVRQRHSIRGSLT